MKTIYATVVVFAICFMSCKDKTTKSATQENTDLIKKVIVDLSATAGNKLTGKVVFTTVGDKVEMKALISDVAPGAHAIHIHANGDCSSGDGKSAGGHWNPNEHNHGKMDSSTEFHSGDIGNIIANDKGMGTISKTTDLWCIGCDDAKKNILGKAIIVHAVADDFTSQPSGAAGARIACGIIQ